MKQVLRAALISGGMYDRLYQSIRRLEQQWDIQVSIGFRGTHTELNAHLATFDEPPYDLISTHTIYAPSQKRFLAPLDGFETGDFFPTLLGLATIDGSLYGVPRNIDLGLLHYRTDLVAEPPSDWDELVATACRLSEPNERYGFVFTGMEAGLLGSFFELAEAAGAHVLPESLIAEVNNEGGRWALEVLHKLYAGGAVPEAMVGWRFDDVHRFFRNGGAAMAPDWPGYYGSYREKDSAVRHRFGVGRMPAGPLGTVCCFGGSHTFALTRTGVEKEEARSLLRFLTAPEQQALEARQGSVPVRRSVMAEQQRQADSQEAARLELLSRSIEHDLLVSPKLPQYPVIENILWRIVRAAMLGQIGVGSALKKIEAAVAECVAHAA